MVVSHQNPRLCGRFWIWFYLKRSSWWTQTNFHLESPPPSIHSIASLRPHDSGLGHVTCSGQWNISKWYRRWLEKHLCNVPPQSKMLTTGKTGHTGTLQFFCKSQTTVKNNIYYNYFLKVHVHWSTCPFWESSHPVKQLTCWRHMAPDSCKEQKRFWTLLPPDHTLFQLDLI